jgi:hypothetical protein
LEHVSRHPPATLGLIAVLAFGLGWLAGAAWLGLAPLRYAETLEGTVALVDEGGTKLCLDPDGGGESRCGELVALPGARAPSAGEHVTVIVGWLRRSDTLEQELWMVVQPGSVGS